MPHDNTVFLKRSKTLPFVEMRKARESSACYHAHSHDEFSFGVIDRGTTKYFNMHQRIVINKGDTVTINPGDIHSCNPAIGDWSYRMLFVDTNWIGNIQSEITSSYNMDYHSFQNLFESDQIFFRKFELLFDSLINESSELLSETLLIQFIEQTINSKTNTSKNKTQPSLVKVREQLLDNLQLNHSLSNLSKEVGLSRFHLLRSFKALYGCTPHSMLLDERIKKAKQLLKAGSTLIETSSQLGFSDQSHFQRHFKKRLAITPKQYQAFFLNTIKN